MNVLLAGASGFVGSHIHKHLLTKHTVTALSRRAIDEGAISCDLSEQTPDLGGHQFDYVVNAAGKAHSIPRTTREAAEYERTNVHGTARLLTALEQLPILPKAVVHISTILVYGRSEGYLLDETTTLNAVDAYGLSKVRAEAVVQEWGKRTGVRTTILRLPLVAAEQPNGNLAAMQQAILRGYYVRMGDGSARRSMVRAEDVAAVIPQAAEVGGIFNLTDGRHPSVRELEEAFVWQAGRNRVPAVSLRVAKVFARVGDGINATIGRRFPLDSPALRKLTCSLTFSDQAARQKLDWNPRPVLDLFT